jgi:hypothetical protein
MKGLGIENKITLKHIVLGYKIDDKNYHLEIFFLSLFKVSCPYIMKFVANVI